MSERAYTELIAWALAWVGGFFRRLGIARFPMTRIAAADAARHQREVKNDRQAAADEDHPGFVVTCRKCGSTVVSVRSDAGYSAQSGGWGGVQLHCEDCGAADEIWSMR